MGYRKNKKNKTVRHYLKIYFLSLLISAFIFAVGSFFRPQFSCANSKTCKTDLMVRIDNDVIGFFQGHKVIPPKIDLTMNTFKNPVLGVHVSAEKKHVYVDLSAQTLYAYEGNKIIMQALISSGKWGRTPTGNFNVWEKLAATRMAGGEGADAYDLPNVPWVMYFHNDFGLHGAYWHDNFGHPMSHGCVNMRQIDAQELFAWVDAPTSGELGTPVSVCDQFIAPNSCIQKQPIN